MSGIKDILKNVSETAKGFTPANIVKNVAKETLGSALDGAKEIFTNVQNNKLTVAQGLQELERLKLESETEIEKARFSDIRDARSMNEKAIENNDPFIRRFMYYLAAMTVLIVFILLILLYFVEIPQGNERIVDMALGSFIGATLAIFTFFFGSTHGSKEKNGLLSKLMDKS